MRRPSCIPCSSKIAAIAAVLICVAGAGCVRRQSTAERLEKAYRNAGMQQATVYPLAGKVTVDDEPPAVRSEKRAFVVMAYDASKTNSPAIGNAFVKARPDGSFEFPGGGLPPGKYVMLFANLGYSPKRGFRGPDELNNLYNDPEVNAKKEELTIDHHAPGKIDYTFNLSVAGETPPAAPGPKALTTAF
jgi:hypothetical protein